MKNISIALIANGFQPHYIYDLANALAETDGLDICLIGSDIYDPSKLSPKVRFLNMRGSHDERSSFFSKLTRKSRYYLRLMSFGAVSKTKIFHVQWLSADQFLDGVFFPLFFKLCGKKVVYTAHNVLPHETSGAWTRRLFSVIYSIADHIIVHTDFIKKRLILEFGIDEKKISVVRHGVYLSKNDPALSYEVSREKTGLPLQDKVVLFFGRVTPYKGLHLLVKAIEICGARGNKIKLVIAGKVYNQEYMGRVERSIDELHLRGRVMTRLDYLEDSEVETLFKASDVVALPYEEASQSGVLFLSYSYGRPVIASTMGSFPEDILQGKTGYLFQSGSAEDLADKLDVFFGEIRGKREESERFIKNYATSEYSWRKSAQDLARVYLGQTMDKS